ncbi:hypothetical protein KEM54_002721 [Ascosphaera aggregata]|nr:hypothetical protein KEM54_002721 [Ascosphaera aggregata]
MASSPSSSTPNLLSTSPTKPTRTFGSIRGSPFRRHQSNQSLSASVGLAPPPLKSSVSSASLGHKASSSWSQSSGQPFSGHSTVQAPSKLKQSLNATVVDAVGSDEEEERIISEDTVQSIPQVAQLKPEESETQPDPSAFEPTGETSQQQHPQGRPLSAVQSRIAAAEAVGLRDLPSTSTRNSISAAPPSPRPVHTSPPALKSPSCQQQATLLPPSPRSLPHRVSAEFDLPPLQPRKSSSTSPSGPKAQSPTRSVPSRLLPAMPGSSSASSPLVTASQHPSPFQNDAVSRLSPAQVRELRESFQVLDRDNDGTITREDVAEMLISLGLDASRPTTDAYFPASSGTEAINLPSYLNHIASLLVPFSSRQELLNAFSAFDEDDSGQVDLEELKAALLDPALSGAGSDGLKLTAKDIEDCVKGFTARRVFNAKSAKGNAHGQWSGGRRPDVLRYQDLVANIAGPAGHEQD